MAIGADWNRPAAGATCRYVNNISDWSCTDQFTTDHVHNRTHLKTDHVHNRQYSEQTAFTTYRFIARTGLYNDPGKILHPLTTVETRNRHRLSNADCFRSKHGFLLCSSFNPAPERSPVRLPHAGRGQLLCGPRTLSVRRILPTVINTLY